MKVSDLKDGQKVHARIGRYRDDLLQPDWRPWQDHVLYVQHDNKGRVCVLTTRSASWAEYDPRHSPPVNGIFEAEGYYFEIDGLSGIGE